METSTSTPGRSANLAKIAPAVRETTIVSVVIYRLCTILAVVLAAGCAGRGISPEQADQMRRQIQSLEEENRQLLAQRDELRLQLESHAWQDQSSVTELSPEAIEAIPQVVSLRVGRLSHLEDRSGDGRPDLARVYVQPQDGRGRFVQLVGEMTIRLTLLDASEPVRELGSLRLGPAELRERYRSGVLGTHYSVECDLQWPQQPTNNQCTVIAQFIDARTGRRLVTPSSELVFRGPGS